MVHFCPNTAGWIWSVIFSVSNLNRLCSSPGLFCQVPSKTNQQDWGWRLRLNDHPNAIGYTKSVALSLFLWERVFIFRYIISYTVSVDDSSRKGTCINTRETNECGGSHRLPWWICWLFGIHRDDSVVFTIIFLHRLGRPVLVALDEYGHPRWWWKIR